MRVHFADDSLWYYKPRSGRQEFQWFNLLRLLNENGFQAPFKNVKVICSGAHCWMESISHRPCRSRRDVAIYYFRAGAILYLVHLLRGVDFHAGNIIAHASQPVLIDCETLSHPAVRISQKMTRKEEGSVLRTGMLPIHDSLIQHQDDVSALGRRDLGSHSVLLNGRLALANQFVEETVAGFSAMHVLFRKMSTRSSRLQRIIDSFDQVNCRYIYRPTAQYSWMRKHSLSPSILTNGFDRSLFLHALCRDGLTPQRFVEKEVQSLERGDIPVLYGRASRSRQCLPDKVMTQSISLLRKSLLGEEN
jgi:lantibiotic modifying enzyme